jgi:hypothetical protein
LRNSGKLLGVGVVRVLRVLLGVQVVEVAEELVEAVRRRQVLIAVAQVVLPELAGRIAERLQELGDRRVLGRDPDLRTRYADLAQAGAVDALAGDEGRAPGRAALLAVRVGEPHPLGGEPVDVGRAVAHEAAAVAAQVGDSDVVSPEDHDVRLALRHVPSSLW